MTKEKIIIVDAVLGGITEITTVDTTKRNQVKKYKVDNYSFKELADKTYNRVVKEEFTKIYVNANGIAIGLNDWLLAKFENSDYTYNPKTGDVKRKQSTTINSSGITINGGILSWDSLKEEF